MPMSGADSSSQPIVPRGPGEAAHQVILGALSVGWNLSGNLTMIHAIYGRHFVKQDLREERVVVERI